VKVTALAFATVAAMILTAVALPASGTTSPSRRVLMGVIIRDTGITVGTSVITNHHGDNVPLGGPIPRGDFLSINVVNVGKKVHNFTFLGKKTPPIKPGKTAHMFTVANFRGTYVWKSTLDKGKKFRGVITIR
jgi:hypothetical protein